MKVLFLSAFIAILGSGSTAQTLQFDFSVEDHMFAGGVSDFAVNQSDQHQFEFDNGPLPPPLPAGQNGQYLSGVNPSDDLFMYMKRQITGLQPFTTYHVTFTVEFASIYPTNAIGVGGAPGEGVTMKAGLTLIEPDTIVVDKGGPFVQMNIDKGNQSMPGTDMDTIGHVGVSDTTTVYTLKTNDNLAHPFVFITDAAGSAWLIIGTDSGFESTTALYYTEVIVNFEIVSSLHEQLDKVDFTVFPNPSDGQVQIMTEESRIDGCWILDLQGKQWKALNSVEDSFDLPSGTWLIQCVRNGQVSTRKLIVE